MLANCFESKRRLFHKKPGSKIGIDFVTSRAFGSSDWSSVVYKPGSETRLFKVQTFHIVETGSRLVFIDNNRGKRKTKEIYFN
jgi:hypothetical protein